MKKLVILCLIALLLCSGCGKEQKPVHQEEYEQYLPTIGWSKAPALQGFGREFTAEEADAVRKNVYDNEELQAKMVKLFASHGSQGLDTKTQVTEYAHLLIPVLLETESFAEAELGGFDELIPERAIHYSNRVWSFMYRIDTESKEPQDVCVLIDETDGHVCHVRGV